MIYDTTRQCKVSSQFLRFCSQAIFVLALLMTSISGVKAADYVFIYNGGYLAVNNSGTIIYTTTFSPQCVWTCVSNSSTLASAELGTGNSRFLYTEVNGTKYWLVTNTTDGNAISTSTNPSNTNGWRNNGTRLYWNSGTRYVYYRGNSWRTSSNAQRYSGDNDYAETNRWGTITTDYRSTTYSCTTTSQGPTDNTTDPTISASLGDNAINFSHTDLSGTYVPQYTRYVFNSTTHNWYENTDYGSTVPSVNANTLSPTYAWSLTANGGGVASINSSTGVLTLNSAPTGNITVRLTVSDISPLGNKTVDFLLTRGTGAGGPNTSTVVTTPTISPSSAALYYNESQAFTSSATATATTTNTPAHTTLTGGGNTYYYYNGSLYTSTNQFSTTSETHPAVTLTWSLSGKAESYLTRTPATGTSTTVTHSTQSTSDLTATLTVTASVTGATNKTATATITAYGPMEAPAISCDGNTISLTTTNTGVTIYYTTDGSTPTASSTEYTGPFDLTTSPTTVKAITIRDTHSSQVSSETFTIKVPTPVIAITSTGLATITLGSGSPAGTVIHYTTDGTTPTASSPTYSTSVQLTNPQTIKAIAVCANYDNSDIATEDFISSGTSGGKVILDDREDHTWTYYSGVDASVDGDFYNRNYGNNTYHGKLYSPNPRNVKITYNGVNRIEGSLTTVKVSVDSENETSFIYFKTLEQGSTAGEYPYQVISNPFSVRPSTGSGNSKVYYGFAGWKIVSGGEYIKNHNNNDVLSLDEEIVFNNLPYPSVNCTSAEIVFETTWTQANVQIGNSISLANFNGGTYETNFFVLTRTYTTAWTGNKNVTITSVYPDGSTDSRNGVYTQLNNLTLNSGYTVKYEYIHINNNSSTFTMGTGTKTLYLGRGISNTTNGSSCCNLIQGCSGNVNTGLTYTLKIESGVYGNISYTRGLNTNQSATISGGTNIKSVLGCDYDRANEDNNKLKFTNEMWFGDGPQLSGISSGQTVWRCLVKSGTMNSSLTSAGTGDAQNSFYIGIGANYSPGHRLLEIEGGEFWSIAGGLDDNNKTDPCVTIRVHGGLIKGAVYGSAANATANGIKELIFTGGEVRGWIGAGANGTANNGGKTNGKSFVYIGGRTNVVGNNNTAINGSVGGHVFGAGSGSAQYAAGEMTEGSNVVVADEATIQGNVYGGGNYGFTDNTANVFIAGGTVNGSVFGGANQNKGDYTNIIMTGGIVKGGVYGGSNTSGTIGYNVVMNINGGQVGTSSSTANIHGGGYGQPTRVSGSVDITLGASGQTTPGVTVYGDVYGGSALGYVNGTTATGTYHTNVTLNKGVINGSLYGGGLGNAGNAANVYGPVTVTVNGGSVNTTSASGSGAVYGCNNISGAPQRAVAVIINGTDPAPDESHYALDAVYGGGNQANYTYGTPTVTVNNCDNSIAYVYGGGNAASVPATDVQIYGGNKIGTVFAGGNGTVTAANVTGNTRVRIYGGTIGKVFGGSNSQGTIGGTISVEVAKQGTCAMHIDEVYGGGNMAASNAGNISIGCTGNEGEGIGDLYGGANQADITGNIALNITGGSIQRVFGGNNTSGNISGTIAVNVNWNTTGACGYNYIGSVFGGGNQATYTGSPTVNILNGTVSGNVYGGGAGTLVDGTNRGAAGKVTGNPRVNIGDNVSGHTAIVLGDVYGGGDAADVAGTPVIVVNDCNTQVGYLYGGGNAADVNGTNITVNGGTFNTAFGGGHGDKAASSPSKYADVNGNVVFNVNGGTFKKVFAGSNSKGDITGTSALTINKTGTCAMKIEEVYGGGNEADGNAGIVTIGCTGALTANHANVNVDNNTTNNRIGYELEGIGTVYGGANQANIGKEGTPSNITLNINSGMVANVFGGNNTSGTIYGTITVNIEKTSDACGWYVGNVFGGGNLASYTGSPAVNVKNGTVTYNVYGGGKGASAVVTGNPVVTVGDANASHSAIVGGDVYGGGDAAAVTGNTTVTYNDNNASSTVSKLFGGGNAAGVSGTATVTMTSGKITAGIYGGCNSSGDIGGNITVNINGGTLGVSGTPLTSGIFGGGFGQSTTTAGNVTVNVGDANAASAGATPTIYGDIYGGSALGTVNDAVADLTTVNFNNGTIHGNIYGGGLGAATLNENGYVASVTTEAIVNGTVRVNIGTSGQASNFVTIDGQVFGCNNFAGTPKGHVYVDVYHTAHTGANTYPSPVPTSPTDVAELASTAFAIGAVYGGGNLADYSTTLSGAKTHVHIHNCDNTIQYVYGGGNAASSPATEVIIDGGRFNYIFGGGNGAGVGNPGADIEHDALVTLNGGLVYRAFGGSNTKGVIGGTSSVDLPETTTCTRLVHELYGGGNEAAGGNVDLEIPCGSSGTGIIYAGANNADMGTREDFEAGNPVLIKLTVKGGDFAQVFGGNNQGGTIWGNVELHLQGGTIGQAFGGNNLGGNIKGWIKVYVEEDETLACPLVLTDVYGGGYNAAYTPANPNQNSPQVFISHKKSGTAILGNVFGGGLGTTATVTGNPVVTIGDDNPDHCVAIDGDVYGGGDAGNVIGTTQVNVVNKCNSSIGGDVYGGGNAADVNGTDVNIDGGVIAGRVFGGGHGDKASLNVDENDHSHSDKVANVNGNTSVNITGGTISKVFAGSNINGTITGTSNELIINKSATAACDMKIGEVYGGGNLAAGNATTISVGCTGTWTTDGDDTDANNNFHNKHNTTDNRIGYELEGIGTVYGGANQADIGTAENPSNIVLNITGGIVENAFGGNNTSGGINGSITVNVEWGSAACDNYIGNVFGGGNLAPYTGSPAVNIKNGTVSQNVYGGGKGASAVVTGNPVVIVGDVTNAAYNSIVSGDVYGGGDAAGVTGSTTVTYNDNNASSTVGRLFGGGNAAGVSSAATVTLTSGKVTSGVYGGCNASGSVGDVTIALNGGAVGATGSGNEADVYGGGLGAATTTTGNIGVTLNGTTVYGDLYGGSALGSVNASTSNTATLTVSTNTLHGSIYGGGKGDHTSLGGGHSNVTATSNGNVIINYSTAISDLAGLYGGANINGLVSGNITVNVLANVGAAGDGNSLDIFGGGLGEETATGGNVTVNVGDLALDGSGNPVIAPVIYGAIYGGSALGQVNGAVTDVTTVNILSGTLHGNTYGGGLGEANVLDGGGNITTDNSAKGQVNGSVIVNIGTGTVDGTTGFATSTTGYATIDGSVYGCNNTNGSPKGDVTVNIYKTAHTTEDAVGYTGPSTPTYAIGNVFGGGRNADYSPVLDEGGGTTSSKRATVHVYGCDNTIEDVFGGGDAAAAYGVQTIIDGGRFDRVFGGGNGETTAANIGHGGTDLHVHGGKITTLFGGSNTQGTITGNMGISVDATGECASDMYVDEFFCGNNLANIGTSENPVNINATIGCGARFGDVYGGCNLADIFGNVTLTIEGGIINNVYGGSKGRDADDSDPSNPVAAKAANITGNVTLNIYGGNISTNAYGGSNVNGNITGSITVNMDWSQASSDCNSPSDLHVGNVYGGSNLAAYNGTGTAVNIKHGTVSNSVFGGGKGASATVTANTAVTIGDGVAGHTATVTQNVYGGGDLAEVVGGTSVTIAGGAYVSGDVYGGGNQADVTQSVSVSMTGGRVLNDIYGGGALANTNTDNWNPDNATVSYYGVTGLTVGDPVPSGLYYKPLNYSNASGKAVSGVTYYSESGGVYTPVPAEDITVGTTDVSSYYIRSYGDYTAASGTVEANVPYFRRVTGGWAAGKNDSSTGTTYKTTVSLTGGLVGHLADGTANDYRGGNVYGGGLGRVGVDAVPAMVYGDVEVTVNGTAFLQRFMSPGAGIADVPFSGRVFGCNNLNGTPKGNVKVSVLKTIPVDASGNISTVHDENRSEIHSVYGGGNLASYEPVEGKSLLVVIDGCNETSIEKVFGGGNSAPVPSTQVVVLGSLYVGYAFGGGNGADRVYKNGTWTENDGAPIYGNTLVLAVGGKIGQVFSGSDTKGDVYGNATVKLKGKEDVGTWTSSCPLKITNTYGAGRGADINGDVILIVSGCGSNEIERVFGGSYDANIRGSVNLTITSGIFTQVFGGNDHGGSIGGNITVNIEESDDCNPIIIQYLYGGGREAAYPGTGAQDMSGNPVTSGHISVNVKSATRIDNVFGGSYRALIVGDTEVNINMIKGSYVTKEFEFPENYRGDRIPNVTSSTESYETVTVVVGSTKVNGYYTREGDVYTRIDDVDDVLAVDGVTYYQLITTGNRVNDEIGTIGNVFGGSFESAVNGKTTVNIGTESTIRIMHRAGADDPNGNRVGTILDSEGHSIYDNEGNIRSGVVIATEEKTVLGANITGNVYGGGNNGAVTGNTQVNICAKESSTPGVYATVTPGASGVTIEGTDYPYGVFGGGNNGTVGGNSAVYMGDGRVNESVYGGGREADVKGNTHVEMLDGYVYDGVYGGGLKGSVGTITKRDATGHASHEGCVGGKPNDFAENTGTCTVIVSGGQVGPAEAALADGGMNNTGRHHKETGEPDGPVDVGFVFGAGRGMVENPDVDKDADFHCYVNNTKVTIKNTYETGYEGGAADSLSHIVRQPLIMASVYGGGENGRVRNNTLVQIYGGQIGCGEGGDNVTGAGTDASPYVAHAYAETKFIDPTITPVTDSNALTECSHWDYGRNTGTNEAPNWIYETYDPYADDAPSLYPGGSSAHPSDGKTYYGCVFGGGSGYYPYVKATSGTGESATVTDYDWLPSAGLVEGNTEVQITGGHILTNVYGGNEYTNVGRADAPTTTGKCTVKMTGGTIGVPRTLAQIAAHPLTCYLFGAGKGDPRSHFNGMNNVRSVEVEVSGGIIYGSVFGGAEDGHVLGNVTVNIKPGAKIGTWGTSYVDGNVFGGGRGFSGENLVAGNVGGNITINITGGDMLGSVYGGGRLGSVGLNTSTGEMQEGDDHGHVTVNISGGTIGNNHEFKYYASASDPTSLLSKTDMTNDTGRGYWMLNHTKGGNVFAGAMGRRERLGSETAPITVLDWHKLGNVKSTKLTISGDDTWIKGNAYGGGEFGAVTGSHTTAGQQYGTEVLVQGGTIGTVIGDNINATTFSTGVGSGDTRYSFGAVYGGGYGTEADVISSADPYTTNVEKFGAYVNSNTYVSVSGASAKVRGSVYGGGEKAAVIGNTNVNVSNGEIGVGHVRITNDNHKDYVLFGGWRMGNVFGGGKGSTNAVSSGLVKGNSNVTIIGGHVYHNVYGGGAFSSVGTYTLHTAESIPDFLKDYASIGSPASCASGTGTATITITGGQIGINGWDNGMVNGSGRGDVHKPVGQGDGHSFDPYDRLAWVNNSIVTVGNAGSGSVYIAPQPQIKGSVYGGGENGHNFGTAIVNILSGTIGTDASATYDNGNVYGAGCGTDTYTGDDSQEHHNRSAGYVQGSGAEFGTQVNIRGGYVIGSAFGGGSMASSGVKSILNVSGGQIDGSAYGGPRGDMNDTELVARVKSSEVNISGGTINGSAFGGGLAGVVEQDVVVNMTNGLVKKNVYGGGAYADTNVLNISDYNSGGTTPSTTSDFTTYVHLTGGTIGYGANGGDAYGGALGRNAKTPIGSAGQHGYVPAVVEPKVYGDILLDLNGTTISDEEGTNIETTSRGCVLRRVFGCNDENGTPKGKVKVHVYATQPAGTGTTIKKADKTTLLGKIADYTIANYSTYEFNDKTLSELASDVGADISAYTAILSGSGTDDVKKAALADMIDAISQKKYDVLAVYGGGNLAIYEPVGAFSNDEAVKNAARSEVRIYGCDLTSIYQVYGGGNAAPTPGTYVRVNAAYEIGEVFGGGNGKDDFDLHGKYYKNPGANVGYVALAYFDDDDSPSSGTGTLGDPYQPIDKPNSTTKEGRQDPANHYMYGSGQATTEIVGGRIHKAYGGSNEKGNICTVAMSSYEEAGTCTLLIDETYGAGKNAPIDGMVSLELECVEYMAAIYGGSTNSDVNNDIVLNITNGTFGKVFGGNNTSGKVNGSITVNIQEKGCKPIRIGELYGGGYLADYSIYGYKANGDARTKAEYDLMSASEKAAEDLRNPRRNPRVNVISATWIGEIYGGGYQAKVVGSPTVNVNMEKGQINSKFVAGNYTAGTQKVTDQLGTYSLNVERIISEVGDDKGNAELSIGTIGTIYGGGNEADIDGSTTVKIGTGKWRDLTTTDAADETAITRRAAFITESVFGGGNNGDVTGNTVVEIGNGYVADRIYGGGKLGNVGTISSRVTLPSGHSSHADCLGGGEPTAFAANTGKCTVTLTGGRVGPFTYSAGVVTPQELSMTRVGGPDDYGYVFGASRGAVADPATDPDIDYKTFVDNTEVIVKNGYVAGHEDEAAYVTKPLIAGGVYGGSENGRVLHDTKVYIQGGQIGIGEGMTTAFNAGSRASEAYTDEEWAYDITADDTKFLAECAHWPYGSDTDGDRKNDTYAPYDPNAQSDGTYSNGESAQGGRPTGSDGHTFYGNVFGGGSGYFPYVDSNGQSQWLRSAGEVKGNSYVTITGGHILTSVYGGNEMTNVLCNSYVTMVGGTLGVPRTLSQIDEHPVTCYLFGGGKGDPRIFFNEQTNVKNAIVHISDDARIYGSVFGGGEDGHVLEDVKMSIGSSTLPTAVASDPVLSALTLTGKKTVGGREYPYIGTWGTSYVEGNVFGGGRGFSGEALTAGSVGGNVELDISGGTMLGSIYGGGRMAAVGIKFEMPTLDGAPNPHYGLLRDETDAEGAPTFGHVTVNISGGTIGNNLEFEPVPRDITTEADLTTWKATNHIPNTDFYLGKDDNDADLYLLHHTKGGNVFGGSMGRNTHLDGTVNTLWPKLAVVKLTEVTISGSANIKGNVYGGGELGVVRNKATVNVKGGTIQGDVYGGGYGSDDDRAASEVTITAGGYNNIPTTYYKFTPMIWNGCVSGNTYVNVSGGWVKKSVYGGGEMASVGLINFNVNSPGEPYNYIEKHDDLSNSFSLSWPYKVEYIAAAPLDAASVDGVAVGGKATVNVTGGRIGITGKDYTGPAMIDGVAASEDEKKARRTDNGDIFGGSKGIPENDRYRTAFSANVKETEVIINYAQSNLAAPTNYKTGVSVSTKSADEYDCIAGSVYGGGEDGHVMEDSRVTLTNGLIGHAIYGGGKGKTQFATKLLKIGATAVSGDGNSISDYDPSDTYDAYVYGFISGRVLGNTHVSMSDGYVVRNIYGGGNMASVGKGNYAGGPDDYFTLGYGELTGTENLWDNAHANSQAFLGSGKTNVTVTGGQVGYIDSDPSKSVKDGLPYGNIFGGCRGESEPNINAIPPFLYTPTSYVGYANETDVTIGTSGSSAGPRIYGSVYGGGQDGHVRRDSYVKVYSGEIGIPYTEANRSLVGTSSLPLSEELDNLQWQHRGNVYGSGSGIGKFKYDFNYDGDTDDEGEQDYSQSSGSVTRFAQVDIFGGTIHRNVYGGGSQASVGPPPNGSYDAYRKGDTAEGHGPGKQSQTTVNISGTVGSPTGYNVVYGGEVYGASRGNIALPITFSTSVWTNVHIKNGAVVKGNVYGGGDAGAVLKDTNVEIGGE